MSVVTQHDLVKLFAEKFKIEFNDASNEMGDIDFVGEQDIDDVKEMVEDGYNPRAWQFLMDFMSENKLNNIIIKR